ncbi:MAG: hypothetical protein AAF629_22855 [Chloroflexota bacterium]
MLGLIILAGCDSVENGSSGSHVYFGDNITFGEGDKIQDDVVIFGGNFTMKRGSEVDGDVVVFGGNVKVDGEVDNDVLVFGGNVKIGGTVDGDITAVGGNINVNENAKVEGDLDTIGGNVTVSKDAYIQGSITQNIEQAEEVIEEKTGTVDVEVIESSPGFFDWLGGFMSDGVQNIFMALIVGGFGVLLVLFFPSHVDNIQETLYEAGPASLAVGAVTMVTSTIVMTILAVFFFLVLPICGLIFMGLALGLGLMSGWTAVGRFLGQRVFARFGNPTPSDVSATFLGATLLTLVALVPFVDHLPFIGFMLGGAGFIGGLAIASIGLGSVVLTRFGTRSYLVGSRYVTSGESRYVIDSDLDDSTSV